MQSLALDLVTLDIVPRNIYLVAIAIVFVIRQFEAAVGEFRRSRLDHSTHRRDHRSPPYCLNHSGQMHCDRHDLPRVAEWKSNNLH